MNKKIVKTLKLIDMLLTELEREQRLEKKLNELKKREKRIEKILNKVKRPRDRHGVEVKKEDIIEIYGKLYIVKDVRSKIATIKQCKEKGKLIKVNLNRVEFEIIKRS